MASDGSRSFFGLFNKPLPGKTNPTKTPGVDPADPTFKPGEGPVTLSDVFISGKPAVDTAAADPQRTQRLANIAARERQKLMERGQPQGFRAGFEGQTREHNAGEEFDEDPEVQRKNLVGMTMKKLAATGY